jgi:hypothetical protein
MRVHHRGGIRRRATGQLVVVGHDDRDTPLARQRDLAVAGRARIRGEQQGPTLGGGGVHGAHREPMTLLGAVRHVWRDIQPKPPQREHEDGQAGQAVGIEVTQHQDPFAPDHGLVDASQRPVGVGQEVWIDQRGRRLVEACPDTRRVDGSPPGQDAQRPRRETPRTRRGDGLGCDRPRSWQGPVEAGVEGRHRG